MINKISATSFKGKIILSVANNNKENYLTIEKIDTKDIANIVQKEKLGYTKIWTHKNDEYKSYYVPTKVTSTSDILSAYAAANSNDKLCVYLDNKSDLEAYDGNLLIN